MSQQRFDIIQIHNRRRVALGIFGVGVAFEEEAIDAAGCDGGAGEEGGELGVAAGLGALAGGLLGAVGDVEDDGDAEGFHDGQGGEIVDQAVVAEEGAALGEDYIFAAGAADFFDRVAHFLRRHELAFFYVDPLTGFGGGDQQIGLPRQKRGDLEDIDDLAGDGGLFGFVDVGQHRHAKLALHIGENFQAFVNPGAAEGGVARTIRLVEAGFEDVIQAELVADRFHTRADGEAKLARFDDTWAGDDKKIVLSHWSLVIGECGLASTNDQGQMTNDALRHDKRQAEGKQFDVEGCVAGGVAVELDGDGGIGLDSHSLAAAEDDASHLQMLAGGGAEDDLHQFLRVFAGKDADNEQAVVGAGVGKNREAGAVFLDVADERHRGGGGENRLAVEFDRHGGKGVILEREGGGEEIAEFGDWAGTDFVECVDDGGVDADAGHEEEEFIIGAGGVEVDDAALFDGAFDVAGLPIEPEMGAHEICGAQGNDDEWGDCFGRELLEEEFGDGAERAVAADDDGGADGVLGVDGFDQSCAIEEKLDIDAMMGEALLEGGGDGFAATAAGDGVGEDEDAHERIVTHAGAVGSAKPQAAERVCGREKKNGLRTGRLSLVSEPACPQAVVWGNQ